VKSLLVVLALLFAFITPAHADPTHLGVGFYFGPVCPGQSCCIPCGTDCCNPIPDITSPQINVSIPYGDGNFGYATLPAGWLEAGSGDADGWNAACNQSNNWNGIYYGTVSYNDGTVNYSGAAKFWVQFADTSQVALPSGDICCWTKHNPTYNFYQPNMYFIRKIKIQSCTTYSHVLTNRFIAIGCDGWTESTFINDPNCPFMNTNWIHTTVSGF
jgi:hypothetical protein